MARKKKKPAVVVAEAQEADLPWLQKRIAQAFLSQPRPIFFVARKEGENSPVIGGASLRLLGQGEMMVGRFLIHVDPEERRQGAGAALLNALRERAAAEGAGSILAGRSIDEDDEVGGPFCKAMDLEIVRTIQHLRVPTEKSREVLSRIRDRLQSRGKIPENFQLVQLSEARPDLITQFVLRNLGGIPDSVRMSLQNPDRGYHPQFSRVLRMADGPKGVVLAKIQDEQLHVEARVVHPDLRGSWVNVVMLLSFVEGAIEAGYSEVFFEADEERHADTLRLAQHGTGGEIGRQYLYGCPVAAQ